MLKSSLAFLYAHFMQRLPAGYVPIFGGNWSNSTNAGLLNCNNSSSWTNYNTTYGARDLVKKMINPIKGCNQKVRDIKKLSRKSAIKLTAPCLFSSACKNQTRGEL